MMKYILLILMFAVTVYSQDSRELEYSVLSDNVPVSKIEKGMVDSMYDFIERELPFIDFDDCNNCDSRAHLMAAILEKNFTGVKTAKVWLFADFKRASKEEFYKYKKDVFLTYGDKCRLWGFHVAPVVITEHEGRVDTIVIDHSTQRAPVKLKEWAEQLVQKDSRGFIVIKDKKYFIFPDNKNNKFEDTKSEWIDDEKKKLIDEDFSKSLERVLVSRFRFWEPWTYKKHYKELKVLLGNDGDE